MSVDAKKPESPIGIDLIAAERQRQLDEEGWSPHHDDQHIWGQLADAAACYAVGEPIFVERVQWIQRDERLPGVTFQNVWPFDRSWYKPKSRLRNLARAGALIAAEMDRLIRRREGGQDV